MRWLAFFLILFNISAYAWLSLLDRRKDTPDINSALVSVDYRRVEGIQLLSTVPEKEEVAIDNMDQVAGQVSPLPEESLESPVSDEMCVLVGPMADKVTARQLKYRFEKIDIKSKVHLEQTESTPLYWVYYPPLPSKKVGLAKLRELQKEGLDSFLITEGDMVNAISLGFFTRKNSADAVRADILKRGFEAQMLVKKRFSSEYWLQLSDGDFVGIPPDLMSRLTEDYKDIKNIKKTCKSIASEKPLA
jgi:hypothetical protein